MKRISKKIWIGIYLVSIGLLGWLVWGHQRTFSLSLPIDFDGFGTLGDFVGGIFGTLFAALAVYYAWLTFKKETIKTRFYEMLKSHKDNVAQIQTPNVDVFEKYIAVISEIYSILLRELESKKSKHEDIFKLSYLFFFYGTKLNSESAVLSLDKESMEEKSIDREDIEFIKYYFSTNNICLRGYSSELGIYFRQLYQTVTFIDKQRCLNYREKYEYIKSLRVCLNVSEQYLLFLNSLSTLGMVWEISKEKEKDNDKLITKYNMLKNIPESYKVKFEELDFENKYPNIYYEYMGSNKKEQREKWEKKYK